MDAPPAPATKLASLAPSSWATPISGNSITISNNAACTLTLITGSGPRPAQRGRNSRAARLRDLWHDLVPFRLVQVTTEHLEFGSLAIGTDP